MFLSTQQHWARLLPDQVLGRAKSLFPHTQEGKIYLNHAATAPMSTRVIEAVNAHLRARSVGKIETYEQDVEKFQECRERVKSLINAESTERISLQVNTSDAINIIAAGLSWNHGDRVLLHESEFPANVWPYKHMRRVGVELDVIPQKLGFPTPELIAEMITPRTRVLALSAVQFLSGFRADLKEIGALCKHKGVILAVDGIQGVGAVRIDVRKMHIDALAAGCQKWQLGPQGTSWLYLTEELQSRITPHNAGWLSVEDPWSFSNFDQGLAASARRFEGGTRNVMGLWGMEAALSILLEFGIDEIESHILAITQMLMNGMLTIDGVRVITPNAHNQRSGIVTIELPHAVDPTRVYKHLLDQDITISLREKKLRFAPHFYNSPTEIALTVAATREAIESRKT